MKSEMEVIVGNSVDETLCFFRNLTETELDFITAGDTCNPNGVGCIHFDCYGCSSLC